MVICFIHQYLDRYRSNLTPGLDRLFKADARVVPGSRPRLGLMFTHVFVCRKLFGARLHLLIGYRSGGMPGFHTSSGRVTEIAGRRRGSSASSALATSRLFVLPVVARRWISVDNRSIQEP